jgi:hypothetical protein
MAKESLISGSKGINYGSKMRSGDDFGEVGFSGQSTTSTGFLDAALFYRLCDKITSNIFQIVKHGNNEFEIFHTQYKSFKT